MRLTQKKIEEILLEIIGPEGAPLIQQLYGKENISEFDLATKTKKDIKLIRRMLYTLYNHNIVGFIRKKDKQKGWYIYYWTIIPDHVKFSYFKKKKEQLLRLSTQLESEEKELFFVCPGNCVRLNFDQAMEFEFHCPECGKLTSQDNNEEKKIALKKKINELQQELKEAQEEKNAVRAKSKERKKEVRKRVKVKKVVKKKARKKKR
ncbi:MAG TPA: hypothetical protein VJI32_01990 [Candidatus Nanoarchaeia archaeon]|nr:hypothetical protein [Candidatus Nanoarchaeia archaeon]